ncbi:MULTISPECIES: long-chain fatty acid--CoA ligase [unclassified Beijerinckia]|uniref:AMP-dependent synthetase/ligase n=1 Tax=unclassified Beijerinckia TaxID=2638183 RepID=UPI000894D457|nr:MULTISPECIES: long-chain fatty acid--CoA ligase [unclassified Beijerinckia]MDH7796312.1 long-chain acyl-CoA synthetase [Beijerinckia sp. GAS462]SEC39500.1 long-chain acyl-CoA synthetase [Beijerinckia sp. 28-YEA-48]
MAVAGMAALRIDTAPPPWSPISVAGQDTPTRLFRARCQAWKERPALRQKRKGIWHSHSWGDYYFNARAIGLALLDVGCKRGDVIAVLAENRPEWLFADMGAQCVGVIGTGIYPTSPPEQIEYILINSGARVIFVENDEQLDKTLEIRKNCPGLTRIVVMDWDGLRDFSDPQVVPFSAFLARGQEQATAQAEVFEQAIDTTDQADTAFLVYTSGTTGAPKGAMISNRNVMFQLEAIARHLPVAELDHSISFLPLCHIAERMGTVFNQLRLGVIVHFPENAGTVFNDIREVAPHMLFAPPRFWEKMHSQIELFLRDAMPLARKVYAKAVADGAAIAEATMAGRQVSGLRRWRFAALQLVALMNVRKFLGLQNIKVATTGAAPVPPDLIKWYMAMGINLLEAYGMTETTGYATAMPANGIRVGTAGIGVDKTELKIGAEEEILVRGPHVFQGYWHMPQKTAEAIDHDGWLRTGDCGEIDADGYLRVKDRLKDIIITSGGKNITPSQIENDLKFSPYIVDAMLVGDGRKYLTCLVMIDQDNVAKFAQDKQVPYTDFRSLTQTSEVQTLVRTEIETINGKLARVEQIKDFRLIEDLLTAEDEELTPTMKLKRRAVAKKYAALIETMYQN